MEIQVGNIFAQTFMDPDKHSTAYLDLDQTISKEKLGLGTDADLAIDARGDVVIVDPNNKRVLKFIPGKKEIFTGWINPLIEKTIGKPRRVAFENNNYWFADPDRHEVAKIDMKNSLMWHIADFDSPFDWIADIAPIDGNSILVLDDKKGSVFQIRPNGKIDRLFQTKGPNNHHWVGISSIGSTIAIADEGLRGVWLFQIEGMSKNISFREKEIIPMDLASFEDRFLIADRTGRMWELSPNGKDLKEYIIASSFLEEPVRISSRGNKVAVIDAAQKGILLFSKKNIITAYQHLFMGEELLEIGFPSVALKEFLAARAVGNDSPDLWLFEGRSFYELNNYPRAEQAFQELLKKSPDNLDGYFWLANCYLRQDKPKNAVEKYEFILSRDPNHVPALTNLGISLASLGRQEEAQARFEKAIKLDPGSVEANLGFGKWLITQGKFKEAVNILATFLELRPHIKEGVHFLGLALAKEGNCQNAIPLLEKASKTGPYFSEALIALGRCYLKIGKAGLAEDSFKRVLKIRPNHSEAIKELSKIQRDNHEKS